MDITQQPERIISTCTGMLRGLEIGIEAGNRILGRPAPDPVAYVEIEAICIANLVAAMEQGILAPRPIWSNLKTFPFQQFHGKVHGIIGGYPCQPFSIAGNRRAEKDPRHLWPFICAGIRAAEPVWCFFENVPGHLSMGFDQVYKDLSEMGYRVEAGIYSAEEVGAPHRRDRLFILAMDNTRCQRLKQKYQICAGWNAAEFSGETMGHTENSDQHGIRESGKTQKRETGRSGSVLADTRSTGLQGDEQNGIRRERKEFSGSITECRFPSRPGEQQYEWEEPRTIEPMLCYSVDGYNFREDLLRGAGNGVVWQTAALAWVDLHRKMFEKRISLK